MKTNPSTTRRHQGLLALSATALLIAVGLLIPGSGPIERAVAQETQPDPTPHAEATPTCNPDAKWKTVGERPGINITEWKCVDEEYQPIYNKSGSYSQQRDNPCDPTRTCNLSWSHVGPIGVYETRTDPDTGENEEVLVKLKYTFTETDSCGAAQAIAPQEMPPQCCPASN